MRVNVALELYLKSLDNQTTLQNYEIVLKDFLANFKKITDITTESIKEYKNLLCDKAPQTIAARLSAIRSFCDFCWTNGWLDGDPSLPIRNDPIKKYEQAKNISFTEFKVILNSIDLNSLLGARDRLLLSLVFYNFGNIKEILSIKWSETMPETILKTNWYLPLRNQYEKLLAEKVNLINLKSGYLFFNIDTCINTKALSLSAARKILRRYALKKGYPENYLDFQAIKRMRARQVFEQTILTEGREAAVEKIRKCCGYKNLKSVQEFLRTLF